MLQKKTSFFFQVSTLIFFSFTLLFFIGSSVFIELKFVFHPDSYLFPQAFLFLMTLLSFFLLDIPLKNQLKVTKILQSLLIVLSSLFLVYCILRLVNIYHFGALPTWFFKFKLNRFITLSPLFFTKLFLCLGLLLLITVKKNLLKNYHFSFLQLFFFSSVFMIFFVQLQQAIAKTTDQTLLALQSLSTPFADRFTYQNGGLSYYGWIWPYTRFITKHTPSDATIMIPTQSNVWKMEGNADYLRWFIYPRKMVKVTPEGSIPVQAQFVLIAQGECNEGSCGWPKFKIPKEQISRIIFISRENLTETIVTGRDFESAVDGMKWGIVELKK